MTINRYNCVPNDIVYTTMEAMLEHAESSSIYPGAIGWAYTFNRTSADTIEMRTTVRDHKDVEFPVCVSITRASGGVLKIGDYSYEFQTDNDCRVRKIAMAMIAPFVGYEEKLKQDRLCWLEHELDLA